jgi:RecA-family ATPase
MSRFKWLNTEKTEKGVAVYELRFDKKDLQEKLVKIQDTKTLAPAEMEKLKSIIAKL